MPTLGYAFVCCFRTPIACVSPVCRLVDSGRCTSSRKHKQRIAAAAVHSGQLRVRQSKWPPSTVASSPRRTHLVVSWPRLPLPLQLLPLPPLAQTMEQRPRLPPPTTPPLHRPPQVSVPHQCSHHLVRAGALTLCLLVALLSLLMLLFAVVVCCCYCCCRCCLLLLLLLFVAAVVAVVVVAAVVVC